MTRPRRRRARPGSRRPPVDAGGVGAVEHLRPVAGGEVVPAPGDERVDAVAHAGHQHRVHAQPGGERDDAVQLVAVRAHLRDGGAAADHGHDALVVVVEARARLAGEVGEHVLRRRLAALQRDRPELRVGAPVRAAGDVGHVADRVDARAALDRQVGWTSMRPPRPCGRPAAPASARRHDPAAPDHAVRLDRRAVGEVHVAGPDAGHGDAEVQAHALAAQDLGDVVVRLVRERPEQRVAEVDDVHLRGRHGEVAVLRGQRVVDHVRERAGELDARRAAADDHEVQRARPRSGSGCGRRPRRRRGSASAGASRRRASRAGTRAPSAPGVRKKFGCEPAASTTASPAYSRPSAVVTVRVAGSSATTSSSLTSTFGPSWNRRRSEKAMSAGASWQVATW